MNKKLSKLEYDGLDKIAKETKMDCWFQIQESGDFDVVYDLEHGTTMSLFEGIADLMEGIVDKLSDYGLTQEEVDAVEALFAEVEAAL